MVSCPPSKKRRLITQWLGCPVGHRLPWMHPPVSRKADSCSAACSALYNERIQRQLLGRVALESRDLCRRSRPTGQEANDGFRNDLSFTYFVFLLDSSEMAQLSIGCSEGRSCAGAKRRLQFRSPRWRRLSFQQPSLSWARSPWHSSR